MEGVFSMKRITVSVLMALCVLCSSCGRVTAMTWGEFQNLVRNGSVTELDKAMKRDNVFINAVNEETGANLLGTALLLDVNAEIIRYLVENGADVNAKNKNNFTPLDLALRMYGKDSPIYKIMLNADKLSAKAATSPASSGNNSSTPKIGYIFTKVVTEASLKAAEERYEQKRREEMTPELKEWTRNYLAKQENPDIRKAGFGPAIFGESMRVGTVYDNFTAVLKSLSFRKRQEVFKAMGLNYNPPSREYYTVEIGRLVDKPKDEYRLLSFRFWEENEGIFWDQIVSFYAITTNNASQSLREQKSIENEIKRKTQTIEGCFELCKAYAPLIINVIMERNNGSGFGVKFYYDKEAGTFTVIDTFIYPEILRSLGYKVYNADTFANSVLELPDYHGKIEDFYKKRRPMTNDFYYWKDAKDGYAVIIGEYSLEPYMNIFPIVNEETLYPLIGYVKVKSETELRAEYDKIKPTTLRTVTVRREGLTSYNQLQEVPIPFEEYRDSYLREDIMKSLSYLREDIMKSLREIGFRKFGESMKLK